jgi:hypothetical protein
MDRGQYTMQSGLLILNYRGNSVNRYKDGGYCLTIAPVDMPRHTQYTVLLATALNFLRTLYSRCNAFTALHTRVRNNYDNKFNFIGMTDHPNKGAAKAAPLFG